MNLFRWYTIVFEKFLNEGTPYMFLYIFIFYFLFQYISLLILTYYIYII